MPVAHRLQILNAYYKPIGQNAPCDAPILVIFVFIPTMNRLSLTIGLFVLFSICAGAAEAYIVAPQSLTVEQLAATPLATAGSGFSLSIPETLSSYVNDPTFSIA